MEKVNLTFRKDGKRETDSNTSGGRQNVSFKFSKQVSKKLPGSNENFAISDREVILSVEDRQIRSTVPKEERKKKLVINPVRKNVWRTGDKDSQKNTLEELAVKELLQESAIENDKWEKREFSNITVTIPMVIQNKIPEGFETDDKLNVILRAEESNLHDYDNVPIDEYGEALLRGLGCKPGDPVGNKNPKSVEPVEAIVRSKGLGLGAGIKHKKKATTEEKEDLKLVTGAYVCILQGVHEGYYGEVEGLDESRVVVKLSTRQSKTVSLPLLYVDVVSRKEFKKESKVINRDTYTEYNKEHGSRNGSEYSRGSTRQEDEENREEGHNSSSRQKDSSSSHSAKRSSYPDDNSSSSRKSQKRRKHSPEKVSKASCSDYRELPQENWLCPLLRVRFIDQQYKKGKFFNQKMIVDDVMSSKNCTCKTEDGKYLEDISPNMLETVVPRYESSYIMVVKGKYKRQLGVILKRDKTNCIATIHFLSDRSKVVELEYDSICEYVGDISQYD